MAGDWLKFETSTLDKPEVWAIAQTLGIDPDAVVGKLLRVWSWFDQQSTSGNAPSVTKALLDRASGVTGFCDAVIKAGWMLDDGENISLPNFERHNGKTAKTRAQTGKRVKDHRFTVEQDCNAPSVTKALPEKRREEKRREDLKDDVAAQPPATTNTMPALLDDYHQHQITTDWLPNMPANDFRELCKMRGVKVDPYDPSRLSEFRMHWHGTSQKRTPSQWLNTYVKSLVAQQALEARQQAKDGPPKTFYELTKEAKERDADKRLTGLASADNATLKALGLLREDGTLKGSSR